ncbi:uncharacterized protein B0I36DRAFT_64094 [Microdochium trichocladiopsis]|uniref:Uncharacterized protein n=1 Tax=Microdochium trichocladiopsis TaxID=1682393 RepID=A0A9P9BU66_9PEZI|nr:uncharacterized protein B0I36DRAFT_64094 [Microdochium trichocladiopsis]KAH7037301.1 hypothetical protein B0I36DRAFT_64094 [Microdochium trichocladiopsis]
MTSRQFSIAGSVSETTDELPDANTLPDNSDADGTSKKGYLGKSSSSSSSSIATILKQLMDARTSDASREICINQLMTELEALLDQRDSLHQQEMETQKTESCRVLDGQREYYQSLLRETEEHAARALREQQVELEGLRGKVASMRGDNQELGRQIAEFTENWDECVDEKGAAVVARDRALSRVLELEEKLRRAEQDFRGIDRELKEQADRMEEAEHDAKQMSAAIRAETELCRRVQDELDAVREQLLAKDESIDSLNGQILDLQSRMSIDRSTGTPSVSPFTTISQSEGKPAPATDNNNNNKPESRRRLRIKRHIAGQSLMSELESTAAALPGAHGHKPPDVESTGQPWEFSDYAHCEGWGADTTMPDWPSGYSSLRSTCSTRSRSSTPPALSDAGDFTEESRLLSSSSAWSWPDSRQGSVSQRSERVPATRPPCRIGWAHVSEDRNEQWLHATMLTAYG